MLWFNQEKKQEKLVADFRKELGALEMQINAAETSRNYFAKYQSGTYDNADNLHNVYCDFGYPLELDFYNYWNMYRRFGIAKRVCDIVPNLCWLMPPTVTSSNKQFENELEELVSKNHLWNRIKGLDKRQRVGRYAGLFIQVSDNKRPNEPIESLNGVANIINLKPIYEGQLTVTETVDDPANPDYGNPAMYNYNSGDTGNRNDKAATSFNIHPSRLIMAAEGADDGSIYGISTLESIYNDLMDLRKICGAGGEGFYQNSRNAPIINAGESFRAPSSTAEKEKLEDEIDSFIQKWSKKFVAQGLEFQYPNVSLDNPKEFYTSCINNIAAGSDLPSAIIIGQQTGVRASEKDDDLLLNQMQSRRENYLDELVKSFIGWCIKYGALPSAEYEIEWADMLAASDADKVSIVKEMAGVNKTQFDSGQPPVYSIEELQEKAEVTIQMLEMPDESIDDLDDEDTETQP